MSTTPVTTEEIADALRSDPVLLDDRFGNGDTSDVLDGFQDLVEEGEDGGAPVYVVMAEPPEGLSASDPAADLAARLHDDLGGGDATFAIHLGAESYGSQVVGFGDAPGADEVSAGRPSGSFGGGANADLSVAGVLARDLETALRGEEMTEDAWSAYAGSETWSTTETWEAGAEHPDAADAFFAPTFLLVAVAGSAWVAVDQALRWRAAPARAGSAPRPAPEPRPAPAVERDPDDLTGADARAVRRRLDAELTDLAEAVTAGTGRLDGARRERVDGSRDTAERVAARASDGPDDLADLLGALVLTRTAAREAGGGTPYRSCALDPRHGEAVGTREVPVADRTIDLPVCATCRAAAAGDLAPLEVPGSGWRRTAQPYLATDSVWAATGFGAFVDELWPHVADDLERRR